MKRQYIIVGGTSGIGRALVNTLDPTQEQALVIARSAAHISHSDHVTYHQCDVLVDTPNFPEFEGDLHGVVYLPGTVNLKPFSQLQMADFERDFQINVMGAIKVLQHYIPRMVERASIVLMSTVAVGRGFPLHASISSAKGAIEGLTKSLAAELAPKIRVNAVAPSLTDTPLTERLIDTDAKKSASARRHPLQRIGHPEEVARAVHFLLSDQSEWVTGQILRVDGGLSAI